ncbi:arsenite methyltransferase [Roseovarius pacificus]|uniref:arsenite methyltransferase n=1 Tax=Roseovarius pacificus TaxID=337701 RepID=UPI002A18C793|nr:arsenite methyltransferase [Roseovarius pacificus]
MSGASDIRETVRERYAETATRKTSCCGSTPAFTVGCCEATTKTADQAVRQMGYSDAELAGVPDDANMGLGCGNPTAIAALKPGETVLDLGSGGGFDCFVAARQVGPEGRAIGVDMTPEMVALARRNAAKAGVANVEFRLGEIEHLPLADGSVDVILSNCVINLSPDKAQVFREAFRVLRPGGRLSVSDVVATGPIPDHIAADPAMVCGCIGNAAAVEDLRGWMADAGFADVRMTVKEDSRALIADWAPGSGVEEFTASAILEAVKP